MNSWAIIIHSKHFSVSDSPKYFGLFFTKRYHYQVWKTLEVNCTDIVWVRDSRTRSSSAVLGKLRIFLSSGGHSLIWPRQVCGAEQGMVFRVMQFYLFTSWTRCFSDWKRRLAMLDLHERYCVKQGQGLEGSEAPLPPPASPSPPPGGFHTLCELLSNKVTQSMTTAGFEECLIKYTSLII